MIPLKKSLLPISSAVLVLVLSLSSLLINCAAGEEPVESIITIITGAILTVLISAFVKEKHLYQLSGIIYAVVIALLVIQLIVFNRGLDYTRRFLYLTPWFVFPSSLLLPLSYFQNAKMIGKRSKIDFINLIGIISIMLVPVVLIFAQVYLTPLVMACFVCYITIIVLKKEKRINIPWIMFLIPVILVVVAVIYAYYDSSYMSYRLEVIITRGKFDPYGAGWVRNNIDALLMSTPFLGTTNYSMGNMSAVEVLSNFSDHNILILLAKYGWFAFLLAVVIYVLFFVCLFKMVNKTRQSTFARYTSLMFVLFIASQAFLSLVGIFLLDSSYVDMPFLSDSLSYNTINYISFAIIFSFYLNRNKESSVNQLSPKSSENKRSLAKLINKYIDAPLEDNYYNDFDED